ncbi:MAG: hypothetical protein CMG44_02100 [Candidatus Marinimicrobia bacterium]|nr:hypothetical protein [Candidatus Neomarinimicrobiota bacterium]|tara:strand:+ start:7653 stop:7970 length:318 start_codon:yes stop_codon:yes gene_type:complete
MKLVKIFMALVIVMVMVYFLVANDTSAAVNLIFYKNSEVPVSAIMLGALSIGVIIGYGAALMIILAGKSEIRSIKNKNRHLSDELNELRNASINEDIYDSDSGDE